eukprot:g52440.t1
MFRFRLALTSRRQLLLLQAKGISQCPAATTATSARRRTMATTKVSGPPSPDQKKDTETEKEKKMAEWQQLEKMAGSGDSPSILQLSLLYKHGNELIGLKPDRPKALELLQLAAKKGHPEAQCRLGAYYYNEKQYEESLKWFKRAANMRNAEANYRLGDMYADGIGVDRCMLTALEWYRKGAHARYMCSSFFFRYGHVLSLSSNVDSHGLCHVLSLSSSVDSHGLCHVLSLPSSVDSHGLCHVLSLSSSVDSHGLCHVLSLSSSVDSHGLCHMLSLSSSVDSHGLCHVLSLSSSVDSHGLCHVLSLSSSVGSHGLCHVLSLSSSVDSHGLCCSSAEETFQSVHRDRKSLYHSRLNIKEYINIRE